jgi:ABC-type microcin C transport system permease subunit YejB
MIPLQRTVHLVLIFLAIPAFALFLLFVGLFSWIGANYWTWYEAHDANDDEYDRESKLW